MEKVSCLCENDISTLCIFLIFITIGWVWEMDCTLCFCIYLLKNVIINLLSFRDCWSTAGEMVNEHSRQWWRKWYTVAKKRLQVNSASDKIGHHKSSPIHSSITTQRMWYKYYLLHAFISSFEFDSFILYHCNLFKPSLVPLFAILLTNLERRFFSKISFIFALRSGCAHLRFNFISIEQIFEKHNKKLTLEHYHRQSAIMILMISN